MEIACDNIDKLINIEMRHTGMPRGGERIPWCDGIPSEANSALALLMKNIVERTLERPRVRTF
jgi:hypothetical protein